MAAPTREAIFAAYRPLSAEDKAVLGWWGYTEDHPKAEGTVRVARLQRWLNAVPQGLAPVVLDMDGKVGPRTDARAVEEAWTAEEKAFLRALGLRLSWVPEEPGLRSEEPEPPPPPKGVIVDSSPPGYRRKFW